MEQEGTVASGKRPSDEYLRRLDEQFNNDPVIIRERLEFYDFLLDRTRDPIQVAELFGNIVKLEVELDGLESKALLLA